MGDKVEVVKEERLDQNTFECYPKESVLLYLPKIGFIFSVILKVQYPDVSYYSLSDKDNQVTRLGAECLSDFLLVLPRHDEY